MGRVLLAKVQDRSAFYAHCLEGAMKGWGTDENALSRILGRNEKPAIKKIGIAYEELYGRSLKEAIESETSGNFKKALLAMLFNESPGEMPSRCRGRCRRVAGRAAGRVRW